MRQVVVLGCTGSIGTNALRVISRSSCMAVSGLSVYKSYRRLFSLAKKYKVRYGQIANSAAYKKARSHKPAGLKLYGPNDLNDFVAAVPADIFLSGISGAAGLPATLAVLNRGKDLALANKESLVMAGKLVMSLAKKKKARLLPVDSEHSSIFKLLQSVPRRTVKNIWLTASGGPFWRRDPGTFSCITPAQALRHPNWRMGNRISVDSATMFNKAWEVIEAHHFFQFPAARIKVVIQPQSLVHGLIEMTDGSLRADVSPPDMKIPIAYALHHPMAAESKGGSNLFSNDQTISFHKVERRRFPSLDLGYRALTQGRGLGAVINGADETAVKLFLNKTIKFTQIYTLVKRAALAAPDFAENKIEEIWQADRWGRDFVTTVVNKK